MVKNSALLTVLLFSVSAGAAIAAGDASAGKAKSEICQGCHGPDGNSVAANFPHLAGQRSGYIIKQIKDYQKGDRSDETMTGMAATLTSTQDIKDIAAFFSKQKMKKKSSKDKAKIGKGENIYIKGNLKKGVYGCVNCHGNNGKGKSANNHAFPVIGGQHKEYLVAQLKLFKAGKRTNDPAGMMANIAKKLSAAEIDAVSEYLSSR